MTLTGLRSAIVTRDSFLHVDDIHSNNLIVHDGRLQGFIDLEMSRFGNDLYLLGSALGTACHQPELWPSIRWGYETELGAGLDDETLLLIKQFVPFKLWIRFAWYWGTDDLPDWVVRGNNRQMVIDGLIKVLESVALLE